MLWQVLRVLLVLIVLLNVCMLLIADVCRLMIIHAHSCHERLNACDAAGDVCSLHGGICVQVRRYIEILPTPESRFRT